MFHLKSSVDELSSTNNGISQHKMNQITATRSVQHDNFTSGVISYRFTLGSGTWFVPSKSYLRIRCKLTKNNGDKVDTDAIAPSMNLGSTLFSQQSFEIGDKTVCRYSDYVSQCDTLNLRQNKSKSWLDGQGKSLNLMGTYADRNAAIQEHSSFEVIYQPQLPIFNIDHALPCGSYQLTLNPVSLDQLKIRAIQAKDGSVDLSQYSFSIETMYLYINQVQGPRFDSGTFLIDMDNVRCQAEKISSLSLQQKSFDISPNANQVTVAFQDDRLTSGAVSPSIFKAYPTNLSGTSALKNDAGLGLNRLFITYNGENQPSPDGDMTLTGDIDFTQQYYFETLCNTGAMYSEGGCESLEDWKGDRGAYYTFNFPKDGTSRSTWLQVNSQFDGSISGAAGQEHLRLLLFDSYKSCAKVQVEAGRVVNCIVEEV